MKTIILKVSAVSISLFSLVTLFMSSSVIFDLFGVREKEGNYVLFVVVSNFIAGIIYLLAAYGLFTEKKWATKLLLVAVTILVMSFVGLLIHQNTGGIYRAQNYCSHAFAYCYYSCICRDIMVLYHKKKISINEKGFRNFIFSVYRYSLWLQ